ncbi:MAG: hypothetical protein ACYDA3_06150 [Gaiellaceae bacterium]
MVVAAPKIDPRLLAALQRLDDGKKPIADLHRGLGAVADRIGLTRPSYQQTRVVVHLLREGKRDPGVGALLLELAYRGRVPEQIFADLHELFE